MRDVSIIGIGQTKVAEHWDRSLRHLAGDAVLAAMKDAGVETADALYVGNMLSGLLTGQEHLGALIADFVGLRGIEAVKVEAACGSGAAALRMGYAAVAGGLHDLVIVSGVEKMTDTVNAETTTGLVMAADADYESIHGLTFVSINALLMRRYMHEYGVTHKDFAHFTVNAHHNAVNNPNAMFRRPVSVEHFVRARMISDPINLLDSSGIGDGAAAVVICPSHMAREFGNGRAVRIKASSMATDAVAVHDRPDPLWLSAVHASSFKAYQQAGVGPQDIDLFEVHDAFTIMSALSLEAAGFAERGKAVWLAQSGDITREGRIPICTMGGLKARGHPVGATGIYQVVEVAQQLRGDAGKNQIPNARLGMAQNIGGSGATVITHILETQD
ncbi:MAG TPA: thiolase domain-containing protein [Anaerolineae bacterium]|nr:thiolase domain-containing protein [Anaerolineae bacterium]